MSGGKLNPRVRMEGRQLVKHLAAMQAAAGSEAADVVARCGELMASLAMIELPPIAERALLLAMVEKHNTARYVFLCANSALGECGEAMKEAEDVPPAWTLDTQLAKLREWRAKYDDAVARQQDVESFEWPRPVEVKP